MSEDQEWMEEQEPERVATKKETDRKCPACGGTMDFDPATGGLRCPYCEHTEAIAPVTENAVVQEQDFASAEETGNCDWGVAKKTVICQSCGAESIYDALEIAGECPYCNSNQVMEAQTVNTLAPGGVCVFKIDAVKASGNFKSWISKRFFCPKEAKLSAQPKSFKGVYLPYWTFDADTQTDFNGEYGIDHHSRGSDGRTKTTTKWYKISGRHREFIDDQPVLASTRHDASMLQKLEPFHTAESMLYKPEYVAGFISERYSIGLKAGWEKAKQFIQQRLNKSISKNIEKEKNADHVRSLQLRTLYADIRYKYLLLPIWISSFQYKGKLYHFMVNGQTGKVAGKTPISVLKVTLTILVGLIILGLIAWLGD